jgi:hypothetical protein
MIGLEIERNGNMSKNVLKWVFMFGSAVLGGCGSSLQEVIVDASVSSAKASVEDAVNEAVGGLVDEVIDFDTPQVGEEQPND